MATTQQHLTKAVKVGKGTHLNLFPTHSQSNRTAQFEQIFQLFKRESEQAAKSGNLKENNKKNVCNNLCSQNKQSRVNARMDNFKEDEAMRKKTIDSLDSKKVRPLSSNKIDSLAKKSEHKKANRFIQYLLEQVKEIDFKKTLSKKSTDNESSSQIVKIKEENLQFMETIKKEEKKQAQLERQIAEESKKHQVHKQLYQHNIERLRKRLSGDENEASLKQINQIYQSFLSNNQQEEIDSLSIESN